MTPLVAEFFCITCSRIVYSYPDEPCPVCSSVLIDVKAIAEEVLPEKGAAKEAADTGDGKDVPPEGVAAPRPA